jgi:5-methyltetrahydrofolate--homocysteine methyltransferase
MDLVGQRFEAGQYYLPELMMAGSMLERIAALVKPHLTGETEGAHAGVVVLGTVEGDIHDIGKDMVNFMLDVSGFKVYDLGVDVPPQKFVEAVKTHQPQVLALSGLLTIAYESMKKTVDAIKEAGLRDSVKIMIGGGAMNDEIRQHSGADAFGPDAASAVTLAKKWTGGN